VGERPKRGERLKEREREDPDNPTTFLLHWTALSLLSPSRRMRKPKQGNHHSLEDSPVKIHLLLLARHLLMEIGPTEPLPESIKTLDFSANV